jgi:phosphate-selective porin
MEEQRREAGCIARRMQRHFHHGLLGRLVRVVVLVCALAAPVSAQQPTSDAASSQPEPKTGEPVPKPVTFVMADHPELLFGSMAAIRFRARLESTFRTSDVDAGRDTMDAAWRSRRLAVEGTVLRRLEFEVAREFGDAEEPERDAYVNYRFNRKIELRAGRFRVPFGRDALTGTPNLDFIYRSMLGRQLAPGRDVGLMAHGEVLRRRLQYQGGFFRRDGDNSRTTQTHGGDHTLAGRVVVAPFAHRDQSPLEQLEVGVAAVSSEVHDGLGLRGRTVFGDGVFFERVFVNGPRLRRGLEGGWAHGPLSASGEYMVVSEARREMGFDGESLPSVHASGWYLAGTWTITGERKRGRVEPRRPLLQGGFGAVEIGARVERLVFSSTTHPGAPFNPQLAVQLVGNAERATTLSGSWYPNRWIKVQGNAVFESVNDPDRSPAPGVGGRFPSSMLLLQFVL